jgi:uncharacterized RDD family membrane protein YckC
VGILVALFVIAEVFLLMLFNDKALAVFDFIFSSYRATQRAK